MSKPQKPQPPTHPAVKEEEPEGIKSKCPGPAHCSEARMGMEHVHIAAVCNCRGCGDQHKPGRQCQDPPTAMFGLIGAVPVKVCTECLFEIANKILVEKEP